MSSLRMPVPEEACSPYYAELVMLLPQSWRFDREALLDDRWYWPIRCLCALPRQVHSLRSWIAMGHLVRNGTPPRPFADNTDFCGVILLKSVTLPIQALCANLRNGERVDFYTLCPLYDEEMRFCRAGGRTDLLQRLLRMQPFDIVNCGRRRLVKAPPMADRRFN